MEELEQMTPDVGSSLSGVLSSTAKAFQDELNKEVIAFTRAVIKAADTSNYFGGLWNKAVRSTAGAIKSLVGGFSSLGGLSGILSSLLSPMTLVVAGIAAVAGAFAS